MILNVVRVDGSGPAEPAAAHWELHDLVTKATAGGLGRNVLIEPDAFVSRTLTEVPGRVRDLLRIAGCLYAADARIARGSVTDAFNDRWQRHIQIHLRVHDLDFWLRDDVRAALCDATRFLTGDVIEFGFAEETTPPRAAQSMLPADMVARDIRQSDVIVLFSGGIDSLAACLEAREEGLRPLLVSHRPASVIHARQENVLRALRERDPTWSFPHVGLMLQAVQGRRPVEFTQRSRAFLFASLASLAAAALGIRELRLCDNGVVSLNLPPSAQSLGTTLSRSTHPGFLERLQALLRLVTDMPDARVVNTLASRTKREVVERIAITDAAMIQETVSCAHTEGRSKGQPHCGLCTQCIDRRFATIAAGVEQHDLVERYENDVFVCELSPGTARTHVENFLRFASELRAYADPTTFMAARLEDLVDALSDGGQEKFLQRTYEMLIRHQRDVHAVLEAKLRDNAGALARGELPEHCLLRLLAGSAKLRPATELYVEKLARILANTLPTAFETNVPANERQMQDVGHALIRAAGEQLDREAPQRPFGVVSVRPDFSRAIDDKDDLYVEFKYLKTKADRSKVHGEMAKDLTLYPARPWLLFVVLDPCRGIRDDERFARDFESRRPRCRVQVVR